MTTLFRTQEPEGKQNVLEFPKHLSERVYTKAINLNHEEISIPYLFLNPVTCLVSQVSQVTENWKGQ